MLNKSIIRLKRIIRDDKGSAIVIVIIALAMVGILAATIMWMSLTNYYMKVTDKGNKQGFYASETVLEQIKAGLEEDASLAASRAYAYILTKDYSNVSTADRDYQFKQKYKEYLVDIIKKGNDRYQYDLDVLIKAVDSSSPSSPGYGLVTSGRQSSGNVKYITTSSADGKCHLWYEPSSDILRLEKIHLEYTDVDANNNQYVSVIDTDIIVSTPDISFTQTSVLPDVFEYALVADTKLTADLTGNSNIYGSIYAGDEGIQLNNKMNVRDAATFISKGDIVIGSVNLTDLSMDDTTLDIEGKSGSDKTEFWANDITLGRKSKLKTQYVDSYIADDITLTGRKAVVEMAGGNYCGYGSSDSDSATSSAIVVNGLGGTVKMDGLNKVTLLGRTFISPQNQISVPEGLSVNKIDLPMGESLAVKGEQVAFLVPDSCLSYERTVSSNEAMPNPFPTTSSGYPQKDKIQVDLSGLSKYNPSKQFVYPPGSDLGYVYMNMTGEKANEYYRDYYKNNKDRLNNYFLVYAGTDKIEIPAGTNIESQGNLLSAKVGGLTEDTDKILLNKDSQLNTANPVSTEEKRKINEECVRTKKNLCAKLIKDGAVQAELENTLFDNLIKRADVEDLISRNGSGSPEARSYTFTGTFNDGLGDKNYKAVFVKTDDTHYYNYNDDSVRVLIVVGNVEINKDFSGLLIASGDVRIKKTDTKVVSIINEYEGYKESGVEKKDEHSIDRLKVCLTKEQTVHEENKVTHAVEDVNKIALEYFVDGSEYDLDGLSKRSGETVSSNKVNFTKMVTFSNWVKK